MRIKECLNMYGFTLVATDEVRPKGWKKVFVDNKEYEPVKAFDIGDRIALRGEHDLQGKNIVFA